MRIHWVLLMVFVGALCFSSIVQAKEVKSEWDKTVVNNRLVSMEVGDFGRWNKTGMGKGWPNCGKSIALAGCPTGFPIDCGNSRCCPANTVCCRDRGCCPAETPLCCGNGKCCPAGKPHACPSLRKCFQTLTDATNAGCSIQEIFVCGQPVR